MKAGAGLKKRGEYRQSAGASGEAMIPDGEADQDEDATGAAAEEGRELRVVPELEERQS